MWFHQKARSDEWLLFEQSVEWTGSGRGLASGVDLVNSRETRAPVSATMTAKVIYRAYELGANFIYVGLDANVLEITPPLTVSEAEVEEGLDIIDRALSDVAKGAVSDESVQAFMNW